MSLWLVPPAPVRDVLQDLIDLFAARLGTPRFLPHLTLLGGLEGRDQANLPRVQALAADASPVTVRLVRAVGRAEYYRAVVVEAEMDPALRDLREAARMAFPRDDAQPFEPHVSLVYGDVDAAIRTRILGEISGLPLAFIGHELAVYATEGPPEAWAALASFPLGQPL